MHQSFHIISSSCPSLLHHFLLVVRIVTLYPLVVNLEINIKQSKIILVQMNYIQANSFLFSHYSASLEKQCFFGKQRPELSLGKHWGFSGVSSRIIASFCILVKSLHVEGSFTGITGIVDESV